MVFSRIAVTNNHRNDGRQSATQASATQKALLLSRMDAATKKTKMNGAYIVGRDLGRRFETTDVTDQLAIAAEIFAHDYDGNFPYMVEMKQSLGRWGRLTDGQVKGVLNCLMAEARRKLAARQTTLEATPVAPSTGSTPVVQREPSAFARQMAAERLEDQTTVAVAAATAPTMAPIRDGFFTVSFEDGTHRTYKLVTLSDEECIRYAMPRGAQHISLLVGPDNTSQYARIGVIVNRQVVRRWRVVRTAQGQNATEAQLSRMDEGMRVLLGADGETQTGYGMAYALASGRCSNCGRMLTVPASVHRGLGPDCASRVG
jgi:hypothetical protein